MGKASLPERVFIVLSHYTPRHGERELVATSLQYTICAYVEREIKPLFVLSRHILRFDLLPVRDRFTPR